MVHLTRRNGDSFALNLDLIERVEAHPDTVITLSDGTRYLVRESVDEVLHEIRLARAEVLALAMQWQQTMPHVARRGLAAVPDLSEEK